MAKAPAKKAAPAKKTTTAKKAVARRWVGNRPRSATTVAPRWA